MRRGQLVTRAEIEAHIYDDRAEPMSIEVTGLRLGWEGITFLDRARGREALIFRSEDPRTWDGSYVMPLNRMLRNSGVRSEAGSGALFS